MAEKQIYRFPNEIDTLEITSVGAKIIVSLHDEACIIAEYDNPKDQPEFKAILTNKTLSFKESTSPLNLLFNNNKPAEDYTITVKVPAVTYSKVRINTTSGGADISGITATDFELNTASGAIVINTWCENMKIQSASGNVTVTNPTDKVFKSLSTRTVSGNAEVYGCKAESFSIHSVSGNTRYSGVSGNGDVSVTSGTVDVSFAEWNGDLNVSVISGNINIALPEDAGMDLKFDGVSGIIKTDIGNTKGSFMNLGRGTSGEFGGENKHKVTVSLTSGNVVIAQKNDDGTIPAPVAEKAPEFVQPASETAPAEETPATAESEIKLEKPTEE